jgi:hypothetical protein
MNETNLFAEAARAVAIMAAAGLLFLGGLGGLGYFFTDKAFHAESAAASAPAKEGKAPSKKPPREAKPN